VKCRVDPFGSEQGPVAGSCEYGDKPVGSRATELVSYFNPIITSRPREGGSE
jgi:hypothetical protein